jgi:hypothetical protein
MEVLNYSPAFLSEVREMAKSHGIEVEPSLLPKVGKIVPGLAVVFLYQTDSGLAFIDNAVTNAAANPVRRARAVYAVIEAITEEARRLGFKTTASTSNASGVCKMMARLGFKVHAQNFKLMTRTL